MAGCYSILLGFQVKKIDENTLQERLESCPSGPGVYLMKGAKGELLYVGKAKNLRSRVRSYFQESSSLSAKTVHLVGQVVDLEFLRAGTEVEALLLENNLIKKWKPKYNIRLKDDKTYPYVKIEMKHPFPRPFIARKQFKGDGNLYFGPFANAGALRNTLGAASKIFQLRDCRDHEFSNRSRPCLTHQIGQCTAPCVGLVTEAEYGKQVENFVTFLKGESKEIEEGWEREMGAAAEQMDFERAGLLRDRLQNLRQILGEDQRIVSTEDLGDRDFWSFYPEWGRWDLNEDSVLDIVILQVRGGKWMGRVHKVADIAEQLSTEDGYETLIMQYYGGLTDLPSNVILPPLAKLPKGLGLALQSLRPEAGEISIFEASEKAEWARFADLAFENARGSHEESEATKSRFEEGLSGIQKLLDLPQVPRWMDCVDISNFQGEANVASAVVFVGGKPAKEQYRRYKIAGFTGQNDFASMKEVMFRRYGKPDSPRPDLLVIDGGRGQLSSVVEILKELKCEFPVVALAKARTSSDFTNAEVESSEERLFVPGQVNPKKIRNARALQILTHIRDEAHRFAITYHRKKRSEARGL